MSKIGKPERVTQNRVIALFRDELDYDYLGDWEEREGNSNIEEAHLSQWLTKQGSTPAQISQAINLMKRRADKDSRDLYYINKDVYHYLRYGVPVKVEAGAVTETVKLIDWETPENNVRSKIIKESLINPAYYEKMSELLDEIIADRKRKAIDYEEYLKRIAELAKNVQSGHTEDTPEVLKKSKALSAIHANLQPFVAKQVEEGQAPYSKDTLLELAQQIHATVLKFKQDDFRGHEGKERKIMAALLPLLNHNAEEVVRLFDIIKQQAEY